MRPIAPFKELRTATISAAGAGKIARLQLR